MPDRLEGRATAIARGFVDEAARPATLQARLGLLRAHRPELRRVLDVGCGPGAFLVQLRGEGIEARGIDVDAEAVRAATAAGCSVHRGEATAILEAMAREGLRFDAVVLAHLVEHLDPERALALFERIHAVLAPAGVLLVATPDVRNHIVLSELFWLDPTHVRPYPARLLERMGEAAGFACVTSLRDPTTKPCRTWWRRALAWLRSAIGGVDKSGPQDLVVVLRRR